MVRRSNGDELLAHAQSEPRRERRLVLQVVPAQRGATRCVGASERIAEGMRLLGAEGLTIGRGRGLAVVAVLVLREGEDTDAEGAWASKLGPNR